MTDLREAHLELSHLHVRLNPEVMAQRVGDDLVLVHLGTNQIFELSSSAARLWELLAEGCTLNVARERLAEEFEVERQRLEQDIRATLATFADAQLAETGS